MSGTTIKLRDLFSDTEIQQIVLILHEPNYTRRMSGLRTFLAKREASLQAKQILPDYLAYVLEFMRAEMVDVTPPEPFGPN